MRSLLILLVAATVTAIAGRSLAQERESVEPLKGERMLGSASELLLLWSANDGSGDRHQVFHDYLNLNNPDENVPNQLTSADVQVINSDTGLDQDYALDAISGDFDGDGMEDYVAVWDGPDGSIEMVIPDLDRTNLKWTEPNRTTVAGPGSKLLDPDGGRMLILSKAEVDDDPQSEFILSYLGADRTLQIELYETGPGHSPRMLSRTSDPDISFLNEDAPDATRNSTNFFDVQTGDFDGDLTDEVVAAFGRQLECAHSSGCWDVAVRVYDVHPESFQLVPRADTTIYTKDNNNNQFMNGVAVTAGQFGAEFEDGIAVVLERTDRNDETRWFLNLSRVILARDSDGGRLDSDQWGSPADTSYLRSGPRGTFDIHQTNGQRGFPANAEAIDFNLDGRDELVLLHRQLEVYEVDEDYRPQRVQTLGTSPRRGQVGRHLLAVGDLDADNDLVTGSSEWRPEISVATNEEITGNDGGGTDGILLISTYSWDPSSGSVRRTQLQDYQTSSTRTRPLALVALDAGDNGVRVGDPKRFAKTELVRPLVILNAPPTHFDVFDGQTFDVNQCYGAADCTCNTATRCFQASYRTETERSISMETELVTDWSIASTVGGGFDVPLTASGVSAQITARYGEGLRRRNGTNDTFTVSQSIQATKDDWIYAMIVNYDIWEYPLFINGRRESSLVFVLPELRTRAWFDSKSWNAFDYIPYHEVGNILSYRSIASPDENSALSRAIRWDTGDQFTLSGSSDVTWSLTSESQTETEIQNSVSASLDGSVNFNFPVAVITDIGLEGSYSVDAIETQRTTVRDMRGLSVSFGNVDQGIGNVRYNVIPYSYWATNGALVLDYAVNPELAQPGFGDTWWQDRYGKRPDPAFILPWRLDREKGDQVTEMQTMQTREILFDPIEPDIGEVVTIKVRVHNWSLLPTPGPVEVRLFVGDPAAGGAPIIGRNGETSVFVEQLADRGSSVGELEWVVPDGVGSLPKIYAVIDPDDTFEEIHETNNKGWSVLNVRSLSTSAERDDATELPSGIEIFQNYPNPFTGRTTIAFRIADPAKTTLEVIDLLGREVAVLVDQELSAGSYNVQFDATGLSGGMYLYRLMAGDVVRTRQMIVVGQE